MAKKIIVAVLSILMLGIMACSQRIVDFTIISSKNVDLSEIADFTRGQSRVEGEDVRHIIIFIPTGVPNAKEALDKAIESVPGAVALLDGVIDYHWWYIPYIYGRSWYAVEGTPLINPKYTSSAKIGNYMISKLDQNGNVKEFEIVDKVKYEQVKSSIID